ncbi:pyridine nucleotide-disulfide oxidoreductase [Mesorhizobium sp. Root157]|uniref:FAD-dependent oxidoreductase n=1 Tax=Mesorhizobium sp. Root157 TaxID=1736477 RepID=UPI0006FF1C31|nr:FAD-dependent oxidoreductase [Mesorhizobium sp. Root157]KQZ79073.1 pyridine nucleotide-disulfide oxidoreductase [Mesorhizobium sp. Root157]
MSSHEPQETGPDLAQGVSVDAFGDNGLLQGHVDGEPVVLARVGDAIMAVGATCTHYGAPLAQGIIVGDTVRCPWHHACFSLRTGEAVGAPAFDPLARWKVERDGDRVTVHGKLPPEDGSAAGPAPGASAHPEKIVIVGGGAAGFAAAEMLRRRGYQGGLTMLSADVDAPYDRPNLSKDYLAGTAEEAWMPLRSDDFYAEHGIDLQLSTVVDRIDTDKRTVITGDGRVFGYDRLLLATGAEPIHLKIPGADRDHVFVLRSMADSRAIIDNIARAKSAVVLGAGFIGLEVAAALRSRGLDIHVVTQDSRPFEHILGPDLGNFIRSIHEEHGVVFHLDTTIGSISDKTVMLTNGRELAADIVIIGVGVRPRVELASSAGLAVDQGIMVNGYLETSVPGIFAAGDAARWHDIASDQSRRVEHWVVAARQGQVAAENMLGLHRPFASVPFFWSAHYDVTIRYTGYTRSWDAVEIEGSLADRDCTISYRLGGKIVAVASIGRDAQSLACEAAMGGETIGDQSASI